MSLEDKIVQDYVAAMKQRDTFLSSVLSFLRAQIKNVKIDKRVEKISDQEVVVVIRKQLKQRQDSIAQFKAGQRMDLAEKEEKEAAVLQGYLPAQASHEVIQAAVEEAMSSTSASSIKDMGKVMKEVLAKLGAQADHQVVSALVKERLGRMT
ncbi:MAG: GatB/YqeY domain-containing protein [Candidatus Omnitrophica bacterium]|nr:GatB/YqeY domain-containing protein [Candidatus Omnitrophota bacterium]